MNELAVFSGLPVTQDAVLALQAELSKLPQYQPITKHYLHGGMLCREVYRDANVVVVGAVHKTEHFYLIASGTVVVTTDDGVKRLTAGDLVQSKPGTKRAVFSETPAVCMTFHRTDAKTIDEAVNELFEEDENSMYDAYNNVKEVVQ